ALEIAAGLIRFSRPETREPLEPQRATLGEFSEPGSLRALDQVLVTYFRKPHSYTAEDVVEVACHGAPVILRCLVECCLERGARAAESAPSRRGIRWRSPRRRRTWPTRGSACGCGWHWSRTRWTTAAATACRTTAVSSAPCPAASRGCPSWKPPAR